MRTGINAACGLAECASRRLWFAKPQAAAIVILISFVILAPARAERSGPFIIGADISWIPEDEAAGATYFDHGVQKDIFTILKEHGFNYIRLRVFVDPHSARGYARRYDQAFCDLEHTKAMAKRIKAAGMGFLLDFHYSDTWADPGHQTKPIAWENYSVQQLADAVHEHTKTVLTALKDQGTPPQMVQIGNEITNGLLWPEGNTKNFNDFATIIKAGIAATREVDPLIKIILHHDKGRDNAKMRWWMDNLLARDVKFDIIGMSCYAQAKEGDWENNFNDLARRYPQFHQLVCEYSSRKKYVNDLMYNTPDKKGLGTFIWEPTRHKEAIFDQDGHNAGGGDPYYFVATQPSTRATTFPTTMRWHVNRGGRYDTNAYIDVYPQIAKEYTNWADEK
jgi:arabinogalactan endo-1,4-beta-galactosidase